MPMRGLPLVAEAVDHWFDGLGGFFIWAGGVSDSEAHDDQGSVNMFTDSEIYFRGNTTLDNGIRVDVIVQLETDDINDGGSIDESP